MEVLKDLVQGEPAWFSARIGSIGGSSIKAVMTGGAGKTRQSLMYQLASEIITGEKYQMKQTEAMLRGTEMEPEARSTFELCTGIDVETVGLILGVKKRTHVSPDGLTSDGYGLELKNPLAHTQCKYLAENRLPLDYIEQVQYSMYITGFEYWHFFSYYPKMRSLLLKVPRDDKLIKKIDEEVDRFLNELDELVNKIK